jgi:hypothetical protein
MNEGSSAAFATFDDTLDRVGVNFRLIQSWIVIRGHDLPEEDGLLARPSGESSLLFRAVLSHHWRRLFARSHAKVQRRRPSLLRGSR